MQSLTKQLSPVAVVRTLIYVPAVRPNLTVFRINAMALNGTSGNKNINAKVNSVVERQLFLIRSENLHRLSMYRT